MSATAAVDLSARDPSQAAPDISVVMPCLTAAGGGVLFLIGFVIDAAVLIHWLREGLGPINSLRPALLAMTLMMVGAQTGFAAFFLDLFRIDRSR